MYRIFHTGIFILAQLLFANLAHANGIDYHFLESTPVGSWQIREDISTDHKGKKSLSVVKSSIVGKEQRDGEAHYWIEMEINNFKLKKDKRKKTGDTLVMKSLIAESALTSDLANAVNNFKAYAKEIIMQTGDKDPIKIGGAGTMADMMMKALGVKITYDYNVIGKESTSVPAGSFHCQKISGSGSAEVNLFIKTIKSTSTNTSCISKTVPFGIVKMTAETTTNNKIQKTESLLVKYGKSGAVSKITKEPQAMPTMPDFQSGRSY